MSVDNASFASESQKRPHRLEGEERKTKKHWAIICLPLGLVIMLAASRWRVRPQRLDGEEDDMTRMMEEDLEERVGGRRANIPPQDSEYIGRKGISIKLYL